MEKEFDHVTLHASLMRSKLRNTDQKTPAKESRTDVPARSKKKLPFDASEIIQVRQHTRGIPIMVSRGRLRPKGVLFSGSWFMKG